MRLQVQAFETKSRPVASATRQSLYDCLTKLADLVMDADEDFVERAGPLLQDARTLGWVPRNDG